MKKLIGVLLSLALLLTLVACGGKTETPEQAVNKGLLAIKNLDEVTMEKYFDKNVLEEQLEENEELIDDNKENAKLLVKHLGYEVLSSTVDGDKAVVNAKITNVDMKEIVSEYFVKALTLAFSGKDEDVIEAELEAMMIELLEDEDIKLITTEVKINLNKGEDNWIIDPDEDFMNAILGDLMSIGDMFGD